VLAYSADFPLAPSRSIDEFLFLTRKWLLGAKGTAFSSATLGLPPGPGEQEIVEYTAGREVVQFGRVLDGGGEHGGARYRWTDDDRREWVAEAVATRSVDGGLSVGTRVYRTSEGPTPDIPPARAPYIVKLIFREFGAGVDAGLSVRDAPRVVTGDDVPLVIAAMSRQRPFRLPVVYVSATDDNVPMVDSTYLAQRLAGRAHVLVEPSRQYSFALRWKTGGFNAYGGAVGIYWPAGQRRSDIILPRRFDSEEQMTGAVVNRVAAAVLNKRAPDGCSWARIEEVIAGQRVNSLKAAGSTELSKYIEAFDAELAASKELRRQAELEIARLKAELEAAGERAEADELLLEGAEQDLYPGERRHLLRRILVDASASTVDDSRRRHLIEDLLQANATEECPVEMLGEGIKEALREYRSLDGRTRQALVGLGFAVSSDGKHHKLVFRGDDRYTFALPKSGSDHRGGLNAASQIKRQLV
jgi:hypothetical protein